MVVHGYLTINDVVDVSVVMFVVYEPGPKTRFLRSSCVILDSNSCIFLSSSCIFMLDDLVFSFILLLYGSDGSV